MLQEKNLAYIAVLIVLIYALYNAFMKDPKRVTHTPSSTYTIHTKAHTTAHIKDELRQIHTNAYLKNYIINVIIHGSKQFDFPGGEMEGGFASGADALKIACYVLELSGKACNEPYEKDAAMFYSSNCAGCHGEDGKGLHGTYPDLTRKTLLGIDKREAILQKILKIQKP